MKPESLALELAKGPLTPLGNEGRHAVVRGWIDAFNSGDIATMRTFRAAHTAPPPPGGPKPMSDEEREKSTRQMMEDLGKLTIQGVAADTPEEVTILATASSGVPLNLGFIFDKSEIEKIVGIKIQAGN